MVNHPSRSRRLDPDLSTLETVKQYIERHVGNTDPDLTAADVLETVEDDEKLIGFEVEPRSVTKYVRDSGEYERYDLLAEADGYKHMAAVVAVIDLGGHYGLTRNEVGYFAWADRKKADAMADRLNKQLSA